MKHETTSQFKSSQSERPVLALREAIDEARKAVGTMTGLTVDSVVSCSRDDAQSWTVAIDVIESLARMGDNDLLATYEVQISATAELLSYSRLRRYHREDRDA